MDSIVVVKVRNLTARHRGGGHNSIRKIDFRRNEKDISGRIVTIEYDPNRNAYICLIHYGDGGEEIYFTSQGPIIGDTLFLVQKFLFKGNALP
ncbi:hypothetical protein C4D60_Mb00t17490 [Musa balbisiana]|uniref:Large ribosomal subunit protein uL2 RNA-binding domain-containing protein n=1 Tax=Musa balbisiana TaxID=52838 RepID=A0A4S8I2I3_MUSBA|nr:hypothetical protein C4D60_Mb00t17490 [Musa balbisiana]